MNNLNFEVFGRVQGVFFRKYTRNKARELNLTGWCENTPQGTVKGVIQGDSEKVKEMCEWLKTKGSPHSRIDKAVFSDSTEKIYGEFSIRR